MDNIFFIRNYYEWYIITKTNLSPMLYEMSYMKLSTEQYCVPFSNNERLI